MADTVRRSRPGRLLRAVAATAASVVPVGVLAFAVREQFGPVVTRDEAAIRAATRFARQHGLTAPLVAVQRATLPGVVHSAAAIAVLVVARRRGSRGRAVWAVVTGLTGWAVGALLKLLVRRVRPVVEEPLAHSSGYSFPSAHALNVVVAGSGVVVFGWPLLGRTGRRAGVTGVVVVALAVGLDRILLGAHFPSDVVAGWLLGLAVTVASRLGYTGVLGPPVATGRAPSRPLRWPA